MKDKLWKNVIGQIEPNMSLKLRIENDLGETQLSEFITNAQALVILKILRSTNLGGYANEEGI